MEHQTIGRWDDRRKINWPNFFVCLNWVGCFKSARNFICQKVQNFSGYVGKIHNNNKKKNYQCLALPKDRKSFCEVQKNQIFSKKYITYELSKCSKNAKKFKKIQLEVGAIAVTNHSVVPKGWKKGRWLFHPLPIWFF